ncbi:MAG: site-specific integrase [Planctomycetota bacterium]|jgi:site-specific recombinase XerD
MWKTINDYLNHHRALGRTEKTLTGYKQRLEYFRVFCKEKKINTVRNLTISTVREYHQSLLKRNLTTQTVLGYLTTVKGFLRGTVLRQAQEP